MTLYLNYWTLASFLIVVFTAPMWPAMPDWIWLVPCFGVLFFATKLSILRVFIGSCVACAVILVHGNILVHQTNELFKAEPDIIINAEVDSFFKQISHGFQGRVVVRSINGRRLSRFEQPTVWLVSPVRLGIGDQVTSQVAIKPIAGFMNEVGFDAERYALAKGVVAKATIRSSSSFYVISPGSWRQHLYDQVSEKIASFKHSGLIEALLFGVRHNISNTVWVDLQSAGLSHLIAISGLHIGIVFGVGWGLGRVLLRLNPCFYYAPVVIAVSFALTYAWLAGFSIPTRRALMMCILFCALQFGARYLPLLFKWLVILAILVLLNPFSTLDMGLWMSMGAVGIIFIYLSLKSRSLSGLRSAIEIQCFIVVMMSPIVAMLFKGVSLSAVLYNLLFVPWFSFIVIPMSFVCLLLSLVFAELDMLWRGVDLALEPVVYLISFADVSWIQLSAFQINVMLVLVLLLASALWLNRLALLLVVALAAIVLFDWRSKPLWELIVLDVGHGLAVVAIQDNRALVYDTGASWQGSGFAQQVIIPYLKLRGVESLDILIVSHFDNDHAGGWKAINSALKPKIFLSSQGDYGNEQCVKGRTLDWESMQLEVLWPPKVVPRAYNPQSCVIKLSRPGSPYAVLLPGDVDAIAEWLLLRDKKSLNADILLVPHHGSKTSSRPQFIDAVSPEYAIASTAKVGRWALPNESVVERYMARQAQWRDTGTSGQVSVKFYSNYYEVKSLRESKGRAWYRQMLRKGVE